MGYETTFEGEFEIAPPLPREHRDLLWRLPHPSYVPEEHRAGRDAPPVEHPPGKPDTNCNWFPSDDGRALRWGGSDRFYGYVRWLRYIMRLLAPYGHTVSGKVAFRNEEDIHGWIEARGGEVRVDVSNLQEPGRASLVRDLAEECLPAILDLLRASSSARLRTVALEDLYGLVFETSLSEEVVAAVEAALADPDIEARLVAVDLYERVRPSEARRRWAADEDCQMSELRAYIQESDEHFAVLCRHARPSTDLIVALHGLDRSEEEEALREKVRAAIDLLQPIYNTAQEGEQ